MSRTAGSKLTTGAIFGCAAVVVVLGLARSLQSMQLAREAAAQMNGTFAAMERMDRVQTRLAEVAASYRGYLLTRDAFYYDRYRADYDAIQEAVAEFRRSATTPRELGWAALLEDRVRRRLDLAEQGIAGRAGGGDLVASMAEGTSAADSVRELLGAARAEQVRLLVDRSALHRSVSLRAIGSLAVAGAAALLALLAALVVAVRSERRLSTLLDDLAIGFLAIDGRSRVSFANASAARILGCPPEKLLGMPVESALPGCSDLTLTNGAAVFERRFEALRKWLRVSVQASGRGRTLFVEDVTELGTERRRSRNLLDRLAATNDLLNGVVEGSTELIVALDRDFRFTTFNPAYAAEFRNVLGVEIAVGERLDEALAHLPGERKKALEIWSRALGGEEFTVVEEFGAGELERRWYEIRYSSVRNSRGELVGAAHIAQNVTARHRAEAELVEAKTLLEKRVEERTRDLQAALEELRTSERRWSTLVELTPQIVWTADRDGVLEYGNARWYEYTGMPADATRESVSDYIHALDREGRDRAWNDCLATGRTYNVEYRLRRRDGAYRWHLARAVPLADAAGKVRSWFGVCVDIHDQKRAGEVLQDAHARLEGEVEARTAELLTSLREKEVLLKEVHHRVKNNLQVICSLLSMQANLSADPTTQAMFEQSQQRVFSMALIHENLYRSGDLSRIELTPYIEQLVRNLVVSYTAESGTVRYNVEGVGAISLPVDRAIPCGLIVTELVSNALKHAFPQGTGTVRVRLEALEPALRVTVADDGVGLPAAFTLATHKTLGLQIVTTLVRQLRGKLGYTTGGGAVFTVEFAISPPERERREAPADVRKDRPTPTPAR